MKNAIILMGFQGRDKKIVKKITLGQAIVIHYVFETIKLRHQIWRQKGEW